MMISGQLSLAIYRGTGGGGANVLLSPGGFSPLITYTQSGGLTDYNSSGTLISVPVDTLYYGYDPSTLVGRGYGVWPASTNLALNSEDLTTGSYSPVGATVTSNALAAPTGATTADKLVEDGTTGNHRIGQTYAGWTSGTTYTLSVFAKAAERTKFQLSLPVTAFTVEQIVTYDLSAVTAVNAGGTATGKIVSVGNGWYRCSITGAATTTAAGGLRAYLFTTSNSYTGTIGNGAYLWGFQLEALAQETAYIGPTAGSAITRAAPTFQVTGTNFSSFYNQTSGTFVFKGTKQTPSIYAAAVQVDDGSTNNRIYLDVNSSNARLVADVGGVNQVAISRSAVTANTAYKEAGRYQLNNYQAAKGGSLGTADTSATVPTVDRLRIGFDGVNYWGGWIDSLSYISAPAVDASLQALST